MSSLYTYHWQWSCCNDCRDLDMTVLFSELHTEQLSYSFFEPTGLLSAAAAPCFVLPLLLQLHKQIYQWSPSQFQFFAWSPNPLVFGCWEIRRQTTWLCVTGWDHMISCRWTWPSFQCQPIHHWDGASPFLWFTMQKFTVALSKWTVFNMPWIMRFRTSLLL